MTTAIEYLIGNEAPSLAGTAYKGALREAFASARCETTCRLYSPAHEQRLGPKTSINR